MIVLELEDGSTLIVETEVLTIMRGNRKIKVTPWTLEAGDRLAPVQRAYTATDDEIQEWIDDLVR